MSKANIKRWAFSLFLKLVMSETVRKLVGREFHATGPQTKKAHSPKQETDQHQIENGQR